MTTKTYFQTILRSFLPTLSLLGALKAHAVRSCGTPPQPATSSIQAPPKLSGQFPEKCEKEPICSSEVFLANQPQGLEEAVEKLVARIKKQNTTFFIRDLEFASPQTDVLISVLKSKFEAAKKENIQNVLCWEVLKDECKHTGVVLYLEAKPECPYYVFPTGMIRMVEFVKKDLTREIRYYVESHCATRYYIR